MSKHVKTGIPGGRPRSFKDKTGMLPSRKMEECPRPPSALGEDGVDFWYHTWLSGGHLDPAQDYFMVKFLSEMIDEMELLKRMISTGVHPRTYKISNAAHATHPIVKQYNDLRVQVNAMLSHLGFGPQERVKLSITEMNEVIDKTHEMMESVKEIQRNYVPETEDDDE